MLAIDDGPRPELMPLPETFLWGCVGGAVAGIMLFILPSVIGAHRKGEALHIDRDNLSVVLLLIGLFAVIAGFGAIFVGGVTDVSMAMKIGFGAQGTLKGLLVGTREAIAPQSATQ